MSDSQFDFVFIERQFLDFSDIPSSSDLESLHLFITHDQNLFENPDNTWVEIYNEHKGNFAENDLEIRNTQITVWEERECVSTMEVAGREDCLRGMDNLISEYGVEGYTADELYDLTGGAGGDACGLEGDAFDDKIATLLIDSKFPAFSGIYEILAPRTIEEKFAFINGEVPDIEEVYADPPGCEGCSVGEAQIVWGDEIRAAEMLDCIVEKLDSYDGTSPSEVKDALEDYFDSSSFLVAGVVNSFLSYIRTYPWDRNFEAQDDGTGDCIGAIALSYAFLQSTNVILCRPHYWDQEDAKRSETLIHEWMHLHIGVDDIAYDWEKPEFDELNSLQSLWNADSYSNFVLSLCE